MIYLLMVMVAMLTTATVHTRTSVETLGGSGKKQPVRESSVRSNEHHLVRTYRRLKEYPDFRQQVSYLRDQHGEIVGDTAIVQYSFQGKEHEINVFPHGNAKQSKPFTRTKPSTISTLKENLKKYHPSEAVAKTRKEMGGCFSSTSEASYLEVTLRSTTRSVGILQIHYPQEHKNQKMK